MKLLKKSDPTLPAFVLANCPPSSGQPNTCVTCHQPVAASPGTHGPSVTLRPGVKHGDDKLAEHVTLPALQPGTDYTIVRDGKNLLAVPELDPEALGGFHFALDGVLLPFSSWDLNFLPKCADPRGQVLTGGTRWVDIYFLNAEAHANGTSRANLPIAKGSVKATVTASTRVRKMNWHGAVEVLAAHGKRLLTRAEYIVAARGGVDGKSAGQYPETTGHVDGLRSEWGVEMAYGCLWTLSSDIDQDGFVRLLGGSCGGAASGPLASYYYNANYAYYSVAARGCCDHLILG